MNREEIFELVVKHRQFQNNKWKREDGGWDDTVDRKYVILGEEVGEVARAIYEEDYANLFEELIQVMAVCCNWLESEY